jgi:hypothetical protein
MSIAASSILTAAGRILQDEAARRWTLPELTGWLNEAVKAVVLAKPSAASVTIALALDTGTLQTIGPDYVALLRIVRNLRSTDTPRVGGRVIRPTTRLSLDTSAPYWHDPADTPYAREVRQYLFDEEDPRSFYVYPGNDGTGAVEAVVAELPALVVASGDAGAIGSYGQTIGLDDVYFGPLLDYTLWRAFSKDDPSVNMGRASAHYQAFATAVGLKTQVEAANSPNARTGTSST